MTKNTQPVLHVNFLKFAYFFFFSFFSTFSFFLLQFVFIIFISVVNIWDGYGYPGVHFIQDLSALFTSPDMLLLATATLFIFFLLTKARTKRQVFGLIFLTVLTNYFLSFYDLLRDPKSTFLLVLVLLSTIGMSLSLSYVWQKIIVEKYFLLSLILPLVLVSNFLLSSFIESSFITISTFLITKTNFWIDFYYLDYGGYMIYIVNLIDSILISCLVYIGTRQTIHYETK